MEQYQTKKIGYLQPFTCIGPDCPDTCCHGWGMQVDKVRKELYAKEAPELLDVLTSGEAELIMKRDPKTDDCVNLEKGLCKIQAAHGERFLGDACYFFPRITRSLGGDVYMTAALSCPEITRLALYGDAPFVWHDVEESRVPVEMKEYAPEEMEVAEPGKIVTAFIRWTEQEEVSAERILAQIVNVAFSMVRVEKKDWGEAVPFLLKMSDKHLPAPQTHPQDMYRLLNALVGLVAAAKKTTRPRLEMVMAQMEKALQVEIDREKLTVISKIGDLTGHTPLMERWEKQAKEALQPVLKRWIGAQLAMSSFPFAGFSNSVTDRAMILAVRFATMKLGLMSYVKEDGTPPSEEEVMLVVQSISRMLDHLADPKFSLMVYEEVEWTKEARLRALIGDG